MGFGAVQFLRIEQMISKPILSRNRTAGWNISRKHLSATTAVYICKIRNGVNPKMHSVQNMTRSGGLYNTKMAFSESSQFQKMGAEFATDTSSRKCEDTRRLHAAKWDKYIFWRCVLVIFLWRHGCLPSIYV